ncbi:AP-1 complex subunit sigma-3 isoform X2 [Motacilla alba alba]|uniref:AP-1 complex subunit sigma-3 isoform X2 n=1 Tax=Motacilla alba alba TaxID=1094192 RepID=UPI0018D58E5C|nr:AP-1 complex subunit sigma-3 isoform X2 [Motacilla alba alba]
MNCVLLVSGMPRRPVSGSRSLGAAGAAAPCGGPGTRGLPAPSLPGCRSVEPCPALPRPPPGGAVPGARPAPGALPGAAGGAAGVPFRGIVGRRCGPASPERGGRDGGGRAGLGRLPASRRTMADRGQSGSVLGGGFSCDGIVGKSFSPGVFPVVRYASLYFCCAIEDQDNELLTLEVVHRYVELLDRYFGNVCELDIIFNFEKAYFILDEFIIGGEVQETSKKTAVKAIEDSDMLQETVEEYMNKPAF